jgi:hypothetical protein
MPKLLVANSIPQSFENMKNEFESALSGNFEDFIQSKTWFELKKGGLLVL